MSSIAGDRHRAVSSASFFCARCWARLCAVWVGFEARMTGPDLVAAHVIAPMRPLTVPSGPGDRRAMGFLVGSRRETGMARRLPAGIGETGVIAYVIRPRNVSGMESRPVLKSITLTLVS